MIELLDSTAWSRIGIPSQHAAPSMEAYRVSRAVNTPRNNREDLLQQIA